MGDSAAILVQELVVRLHFLVNKLIAKKKNLFLLPPVVSLVGK